MQLEASAHIDYVLVGVFLSFVDNIFLQIVASFTSAFSCITLK